MVKSQTEFELGNYIICSVTTTSHEVVGVKLNRKLLFSHVENT